MADVEKLRKEQAAKKAPSGKVIKVDYANPEKAREDMDKKIREYYSNSAHELKIVMDCFMKEGFTRTEAFEIAKILVNDN